MPQTAPKLFNYQNLNSYLADILEFKQKEKAQFSLRAWALKMGFASPSTLSEIISSKRKILPSHMPKLLRGLKLTPNEKSYFEALVHFENAESAEEQEYYREELTHLKMIQSHEHCFIGNIHFPLVKISEAIELSEKLNEHLRKIEPHAHHLEEYQLYIQFVPKR